MTIKPLASAAPTVNVNAGAPAQTPAASHEVSTRPAYSGGSYAAGNSVEVRYYEGQGCSADVFDNGDDSGEGCSGDTSESGSDDPPPQTDPSQPIQDPSGTQGDDDDDTNKPATDPSNNGDDDDKKGDDDDADAGTGNDVHVMNVAPAPHHRSSSPVARFAFLGIALALPLRRRRWRM